MRVAVLDDYQQVASGCAPWGDLGDDAEVRFLPEPLTGDRLVSALADIEVVVAMRERTAFPAELIERLPALRLLVTTGLANAAIDVRAAQDHGVTVCGTRSLASPTAELTWGLILGLARHIAAEDASIRSGGWQTTVGQGIEGRTLGVVGLGRLGERVAAVGLAFGLRVLAWSTNLDPALARAQGVQPASKDEMLAEADVVSLHLRLSERTRGIISARELRAMKPSALLVNTARGPLVDQAALLRALHEGWIAGAALDVYDEEPLAPDHPLRRAPHTLLTPHLGYVVEGGYRLFYGDAVEDIVAWRAGTALRVVAT